MFARAKKAFGGAVAAGLAALGTALVDGTFDSKDLAIVAGATVGGFILVWITPKNADTTTRV
jgi:hypothetical protein